MFILLSSEFLHLRSVRWILADLYSFYQIQNFCILSQFYSHFIKRRIRAIKEIANRTSAHRLRIFDQRSKGISGKKEKQYQSIFINHVLLIHVFSTRDLSIHVLLTHVLLTRVLLIHDLSIHALLTHDLSVHVLLIHILPTHDLSVHVLLIHVLSTHVLSIHVLLIHDLSIHVLLIHVSLTLGRSRVVGVVVGCHPPLRIFCFFFFP